MRIIVYDNSGHPFQVQLSRALANKGHQVLHLFSKSFQTPKGNLIKKEDDPFTFNIKGLSLSKSFNKYSFFERWIQEKKFGKLVSKEIESFLPDVLISSNVPIDTQEYVLNACKKCNAQFVFWVQDFYGIAIKKILTSKLRFLGSLIGSYYVYREKQLLRKSDKIILISEDFKNILNLWKLSKSNVFVIPNWAPIQEISVETKKNSWSEENDFHDNFCFIYSGTLGLKHNPELLIELAKEFNQDRNVKVVVVSEGIGANWLKKKKEECNLQNLIVMDFQPFEVLPKVFGTADVLISILEEDAGIYSVPSKVLSYLCAKRALLLSVPKDNMAAKIVQQFNMGLVSSPNELSTFIEAARLLYENKKMRTTLGINSRNYAEKYFNIEDITNQFLNIIKKKE